jgi:hypothetical protein
VRGLAEAAGYVLNGVGVVPGPRDGVLLLAHLQRIRQWAAVPTTSENTYLPRRRTTMCHHSEKDGKLVLRFSAILDEGAPEEVRFEQIV